MPANIDDLVVRVADICTYKGDMVPHRPLAYLVSGFMGGAVVVFGATLALSVSAGLANLVMGLVFMFSLVIILVSGMTLVTADMYIGVIGVFHGRIAWGLFAGFVAVTWLAARAYGSKHPGYPGQWPGEEEEGPGAARPERTSNRRC